jgi:asparagine synthase (glutamine-hydrolysing)
MCGICGIVYQDPTHPVDRRVLVQMRDVLTHRGPDDAGYYVSPGVGLGSRRLAILDLSDRGHMPMSTPDGRFWIVYNGEIYNYQELRAPLEARGCHFLSNTDTEVLLNLFAAEGSAMLQRLNGMFAFAIWDARERQMFVARDRLGVKPLFYAMGHGTLYFASEEKALFAAGIPARFDHGVWQELLCFRFVTGEQTPFEGVRRLLPGHYMLWKDGRAQIRRWWNLAERARTFREAPVHDPVQWYREAFDDAVNVRRISDVPVGVLLSGGLDSSTVAASLSMQAGSQVASFTVGFAEPRYDETPLARQMAAHCQLEGHYIEVPSDRLLSQLRQACWYNDEPLAHHNDPHLLAISQHAKPRVTVLLSGEGADETLGGYVRYRPLRYPALLTGMKPILRRLKTSIRRNPRWNKLGRFLELGPLQRFVLYNACETLPGDLAQLGLTETAAPSYRERVLAEAEGLYPGDLMRQAMYSDQHTFLCSVLDRNDRMTMGASIECRVPFLDYRLVEGLAALPTRVLLGGQGSKPLLRRSLGDRLPNDIIRHPKWGFGVPWKTYIRNVPELRRTVEDLPRNELLLEAPIDQRRLKERLQSFWAGDDRCFPLILQLVMATQAWEALRTRIPKHASSSVQRPAPPSHQLMDSSLE